MILVDVGIFAHNEAATIRYVFDDLLAQDLISDRRADVVLHVLANGCTDTTSEVACSIVAKYGLQDFVRVHDLPQGGKSRTWNRFVHDLSRPEADYLVFVDADIQIPKPIVLKGLVELLVASTDLDGAVSRPVKDIVHNPRLKRGPLDSLIAVAGGTLNNWKNSVTGGLYVLRAPVARGFYLPIGLPTEDGFVRALVQTRNFEQVGDRKTRLNGKEELFFVYESERSVRALIRHQTRVVVGGAINAAIFRRLHSLQTAERLDDLAQSAREPDWLPSLLAQELPRRPYGYVPFGFLFKRLRFWAKSTGRFRPKRLAVVAVGFVFDLIVYIRAQHVMWRGKGAGYW